MQPCFPSSPSPPLPPRAPPPPPTHQVKGVSHPHLFLKLLTHNNCWKLNSSEKVNFVTILGGKKQKYIIIVYIINPRCACAARVIVVVVCVCMCVCMCVCVYVCVTIHNCRLTHWNHKTEIPTCSQQYSDRFKFCRFS